MGKRDNQARQPERTSLGKMSTCALQLHVTPKSTPLKTPRENLDTRVSRCHSISLSQTSFLNTRFLRGPRRRWESLHMSHDRRENSLDPLLRQHLSYLIRADASSFFSYSHTCQLLWPHGKIEQNDLIKATNAVTAILRMTTRARIGNYLRWKRKAYWSIFFSFEILRNPFGSSGKPTRKKETGTYWSESTWRSIWAQRNNILKRNCMNNQGSITKDHLLEDEATRWDGL